MSLTVFKDDKSATGYEIRSLMDTGAECNVLPVDAYKQCKYRVTSIFIFCVPESSLL